MSTTSGDCSRPRIGGVKPTCFAASSRALPCRAWFCSSQLPASSTSWGFVDDDQHLAEHDVRVQRHRGEEFFHRLGGPRRCRRRQRLRCRRCIGRCRRLRLARPRRQAVLRLGSAGSLLPQPDMATSIATMAASVAPRSALVPIIVLLMYSSTPPLLRSPASESALDRHAPRAPIRQAVAHLAGTGRESLVAGCYGSRMQTLDT